MQSQVQRMLHSTLTLIFPYAGIIQIRSKGYILSAPGQIGAHPNIFILIFPYAGIIQIRSKGYILSAPGQIGAHPNIFIQFSDSVYSLFRIITEFPI